MNCKTYKIVDLTTYTHFLSSSHEVNIMFYLSERIFTSWHMRTAHGGSQPYPQNARDNPQITEPYPPSSSGFHSSPPSQMDKIEEKFQFVHPFTIIVAGPTMSGKSTWIKNLLLLNKQLISPPSERILWIYKRWQPLYDELTYWISGIKFIQGIMEDIKTDTFINSRE